MANDNAIFDNKENQFGKLYYFQICFRYSEIKNDHEKIIICLFTFFRICTGTTKRNQALRRT